MNGGSQGNSVRVADDPLGAGAVTKFAIRIAHPLNGFSPAGQVPGAFGEWRKSTITTSRFLQIMSGDRFIGHKQPKNKRECLGGPDDDIARRQPGK